VTKKMRPKYRIAIAAPNAMIDSAICRPDRTDSGALMPGGLVASATTPAILVSTVSCPRL
jgi:hypothetical protein